MIGDCRCDYVKTEEHYKERKTAVAVSSFWVKATQGVITRKCIYKMASGAQRSPSKQPNTIFQTNGYADMYVANTQALSAWILRLFGYYVLFLVSKTVYNIYSHPLRKFPGPWVNKISIVCSFLHNWTSPHH